MGEGGMETTAPREQDAIERGLLALSAWMTRHWLAVITLAAGVFIALPLLAPFLAMYGHNTSAGAIYATYRITCHQLPQRSWFIGGPKAAYSWPEVQPYVAQPAAGPLMAFHSPLDNRALGYQLGFCQRDTAIYLSVFLTCLVYGLLRRRRTFGPMPVKYYLIFMIPMAIDGVTQLIGLRESTPLLRTVTGSLFGIGSAWLILTFIDAGFRESATFLAPKPPAASA
jgi:uncharacterized membrane protein